MKKGLLFLASMMMLMFTGCNQIEPTEVDIQQSTDKVSIVGFVRYSALDKNGNQKEPEVLQNQDVVLYYGVADEKDATKIAYYKHFDLKTNNVGRFSMELGVKPGQTIAEVKVQSSMLATSTNGKTQSYAANEKGKMVEVDTEYFVEIIKKNLVAGKEYYYDVLMVPVAYPNDPDVVQPK
ncbi:MAG: hypothetical protein IKT13_03010 [Paludibacteraceae bacterium]|nr:hypothetical protein [Paludibacteraceae bacterium]